MNSFSRLMARLLLPLGLPALLWAAAAAQQKTSAKVDFAHDIQPLFKASCYQCHSGIQQQGGLRLDARSFLLKGGANGIAVVPGKSDKSLLVIRLTGHDGKPRMPLGFAPLTEKQIALVKQWIDQGADWSEGTNPRKHWAFTPPVRPKLPSVKNAAWVRNPIDVFVLAKLEKTGLKPSPEANRVTLLRRVTLDLTGLPPTPKEMDSFLADKSSNAYEKVVDRLLASPHYGERMALPWLDAARYADSNGFQQDGDTYQYLWRDWVVRALNANMPFDQFTIEQLAGDLLPNATDDQKIATGFNRCHLLNGEGGAIPEEQRHVILFDRVDVTATNWLGATMACAQCHDHKYDPYTQRDYYSFMAFFNNVPETGVPPGGGQYRIAEPFLMAGDASEMAKLKEFETQVANARAKADTFVKDHANEIQTAQTAWEAERLKNVGATAKRETWQYLGPFKANSFDAAFDTAFPPEKQIDLNAKYENDTLKWTAKPEWEDGKPQPLSGDNAAFYLYRVLRADRALTLPLSLGSDDAIKVWLNGKPILANKVTRAALPDQEKVTLNLNAGENALLVKIVNGGGVGGFYFKLADDSLPADVQTILTTAADKRTPEAAQKLRDAFLAMAPPTALQETKAKLAALEKERDAYRAALPRVMIMSDDRPRKTFLLNRGNYESPGEEVKAATPAFLPAMPANAPQNRLGLAKWLVSPQHPLTARVQINRIWQTFFGRGLVKTAEDFGLQGERPTHPELLDWLSMEFMKPTNDERRKTKDEGQRTNEKRERLNGADSRVTKKIPSSLVVGPSSSSAWDMKHIVRLIVTSATYRQSSKVTPELKKRDPENLFYARGARFRLPSLVLRDVALASSGLMNAKIGGKPVYPYQPEGIWDGLSITKERDFTYPQSKGADLYRRSLYTFWRRTVAPSNMFDASVRNTCKVRASLTSTPLHALTMLNDITWVEAGRALAERVLKETRSDPDARLAEAFRRVCARRPAAKELAVLRRSLNRALATYRSDKAAAEAYLKIGDSPRDTAIDPIEHAAYASVCLAIFNLDEALTRE